jgi:hypothetical protein
LAPGEIGGTELFRLDPATPVFGHGGWQEALDDLRVRRRGRKERLKAWRAEAPLKAIAFEPARDPDTGVDAQDVVQVHLEHRLVRRLLSRFLSQGFTSACPFPYITPSRCSASGQSGEAKGSISLRAAL